MRLGLQKDGHLAKLESHQDEAITTLIFLVALAVIKKAVQPI